MPVLVVGADTTLGDAIVRAFADRGGELRVFVSDPDAGESFRTLGAKVAIGDVSDSSHVMGAASGAHTMVLVTSAAGDGRDLAFGDAAEAVAGWVGAATDAGVSRVIVVGEGMAVGPFETAVVAVDGSPPPEVAIRVTSLDEAPVRREV